MTKIHTVKKNEDQVNATLVLYIHYRNNSYFYQKFSCILCVQYCLLLSARISDISSDNGGCGQDGSRYGCGISRQVTAGSSDWLVL